MYRYVALRKKLRGVDELHMYDVYVSLTKAYEQKYTYEQAAFRSAGWMFMRTKEKRAVLTPGVLTIPIRMC